MHVAIWVKTFPPQYETFIVRQIAGLIEQGCDAQVIASRRGTQWEQVPRDVAHSLQNRIHYPPVIPGSRWKRAATAFLRSAGIARHSPRTAACVSRALLSRAVTPSELAYESRPLRERPFDVVHCQYASLGRLAVELRLMGLLDAPVVTSVRGHDLSRAEARPEKYQNLFRHARFFLPVCEGFRTRLLALGCPAEKILVHRSGIDREAIRRAGLDAAPRTAEDGTIRVVSVGRLVEKKGIADALRAVQLLGETAGPLLYEIIGDGPLRPLLGELSEELGISERVSFSGWLSHQETLQRIAAANVVLLPCVTASDGTQEGIPNALKEAIALGVPVVATRHSGIPELVDDGITGRLVPEGCPVEICDAVRKVLHPSAETLAQREVARARVTRDYDPCDLTTRLLGIYREAMA